MYCYIVKDLVTKCNVQFGTNSCKIVGKYI